MNLRFGGVADGRRGDAEGDARVAGNGEIERFALVWCGRPKRSDDNRCDDRLLRGQELVG